jgi:alkanesulfonate monooxygenase SsuD/methylene tetrahydromethanopterin reductase-like flavin-dependent oxidoreductase (luciferase family)
MVAALAPRMLKVAGELADGTITYWANERALGEHIVPGITAAAEAATRPAPRVVVGLPVAVCADADAGRERAAKLFATYLNIPTYQRILARGGDDTSPADVAIIGTEAEVTARLRSYAAAGATDLCATALGLDDDRDASQRRTVELLASLAPDLEQS